MTLEVTPLPGVPEVRTGDDLTGLLLDACQRAGLTLADGDVVCVAQKIVSKAEAATVTVDPTEPTSEARRRIAREQAVRVVADTPHVLIVETEHGFICANAGVDASNLPAGTLALLPEDPDASARRLAEGVRTRAGARIGVIVTDTFGRPWRMGQTDVAIGVAGIAPLRDERGGPDRSGRELDVTVVAVADELAAAADLVRRKADGAPFVVVRGADVDPDDGGSARALVRPADEDLFRHATPPGV
jgi:coenzyme F420-0:L-glutamate ligase / coenzyme F420-1:gamma-L-glutamate ligase